MLFGVRFHVSLTTISSFVLGVGGLCYETGSTNVVVDDDLCEDTDDRSGSYHPPTFNTS